MGFYGSLEKVAGLFRSTKMENKMGHASLLTILTMSNLLIQMGNLFQKKSYQIKLKLSN